MPAGSISHVLSAGDLLRALKQNQDARLNGSEKRLYDVRAELPSLTRGAARRPASSGASADRYARSLVMAS